eukprot:CAMPEP_0194442788 /NCGR_PEP_ID=MMETSP0176-20130528/126334_1 /TAXON_ID=216777 /ORGANISM="Proboscia alata, Strain PI-D3" /LENGTH=538 /DNA_ID=CAMNT_0039268943 /DNA_START=69 /DNA_END=1686 /DNA_ORIENTATION=-
MKMIEVNKNKARNTLQHNTLKPRPIVFCGPSGVGKGTLIEMLMKHFPNEQFGFSVSHTTRKPRDGEKDGVHYNFSTVDNMREEISDGKFVEHAEVMEISMEQVVLALGEEDGVHYNFSTVENMREEISDGKFIEHAEVHGNFYGTSCSGVESVQSSGKVCILDIDVQGVRNVKESTLDPYYVFIAPPSMDALEKRLRGRGSESEDDVNKRLANATNELEYGKGDGNFDHVLTNDNVSVAFDELVGLFMGWFPHLKGVDSHVTSSLSPRPVVFCGPSGVGKGTLIDMLMKQFPNEQFGFSVSHTTRKPRDGEEDGVHYNFSTVENMREEISDGKFIEHAEVHGNFYGTSCSGVESVQSSGKVCGEEDGVHYNFSSVENMREEISDGKFIEHAEVNGNIYGTSFDSFESYVETGKVCILDVDVQGVKNMKRNLVNANFIFVAPVSIDALSARLRNRGSETEDEIKKRITNASVELEYGLAKDHFDLVVINDVLSTAIEDLTDKIMEWYPELKTIDYDDDEIISAGSLCVQLYSNFGCSIS